MRKLWTAPALLFAALGLAPQPARADVLTLECKHGKAEYKVVYDTETRAFARQDPAYTQKYKVVRVQFENGDGLVWGMTSEHGRDVLAFFGSKTMMKYFFGNGSETTDDCVQK